MTSFFAALATSGGCFILSLSPYLVTGVIQAEYRSNPTGVTPPRLAPPSPLYLAGSTLFSILIGGSTLIWLESRRSHLSSRLMDERLHELESSLKDKNDRLVELTLGAVATDSTSSPPFVTGFAHPSEAALTPPVFNPTSPALLQTLLAWSDQQPSPVLGDPKSELTPEPVPNPIEVQAAIPEGHLLDPTPPQLSEVEPLFSLPQEPALMTQNPLPPHPSVSQRKDPSPPQSSLESSDSELDLDQLLSGLDLESTDFERALALTEAELKAILAESGLSFTVSPAIDDLSIPPAISTIQEPNPASTLAFEDSTPPIASHQWIPESDLPISGTSLPTRARAPQQDHGSPAGGDADINPTLLEEMRTQMLAQMIRCQELSQQLLVAQERETEIQSQLTIAQVRQQDFQTQLKSALFREAQLQVQLGEAQKLQAEHDQTLLAAKAYEEQLQLQLKAQVEQTSRQQQENRALYVKLHELKQRLANTTSLEIAFQEQQAQLLSVHTELQQYREQVKNQEAVHQQNQQLRAVLLQLQSSTPSAQEMQKIYQVLHSQRDRIKELEQTISALETGLIPQFPTGTPRTNPLNGHPGSIPGAGLREAEQRKLSLFKLREFLDPTDSLSL